MQHSSAAACQTAAMVRVDNLVKTFRDSKRGEVFAVDHVSFDVRSGEIFGLLGPNGAGKTTTLRLISTLLRPTSGTATLSGCDIVREPSKVRAQIGFSLGRDRSLRPVHAARDTHLLWPDEWVGRQRIGPRVEATIQKFGITSFADTRADKLAR